MTDTETFIYFYPLLALIPTEQQLPDQNVL